MSTLLRIFFEREKEAPRQPKSFKHRGFYWNTVVLNPPRGGRFPPVVGFDTPQVGLDTPRVGQLPPGGGRFSSQWGQHPPRMGESSFRPPVFSQRQLSASRMASRYNRHSSLSESSNSVLPCLCSEKASSASRPNTSSDFANAFSHRFSEASSRSPDPPSILPPAAPAGEAKLLKKFDQNF